MFAIPFLRKLVRSLPLAVVLAGFIWGFGHAGYPNQPFYIRGVEVGIGGVALGLIMLRWGILPTLVWHYSVDAMYSAMLLLRSHSLYFKLSGAASAGIVVLPVLVALVAYWRRGGFEPEAGLLNARRARARRNRRPKRRAGAARRQRRGYRAAGQPVRLAAVAIFAAGLAALADSGGPLRRLAQHTSLTRGPGARAGRRFPARAGHRPGAVPPRHLSRGALGRRRQPGGQVFPGARADGGRLQPVRALPARPALGHALFQIARPGRDAGLGASRNRQDAGLQPHPPGRPPGRRPRRRSGAPDRRRLRRRARHRHRGHGSERKQLGKEESAARPHPGVGSAPPATRATWTKRITAWKSRSRATGVSSWRAFWKIPETYTRRREQRISFRSR